MNYALIFPGQGSQRIGMGKEIFDAYPSARLIFEEVDDVLDQKLSKLIFEGDENDLILTENAQPALMTVSLAILHVLEKEGGFNLKSSVKFLGGHSLGEYSALCAGKTFSLSDTARLLRIRGRAMQKAVPPGIGCMAAILGLDLKEVETLTISVSTPLELCVIANDNSIGQVVISGHRAAVERALMAATAQGAKRSVMLSVSAPFHSPLMSPAAHKMKDALAEITGGSPVIPLIANVTAEPVYDFDVIRELLYDQVTERVRWRESILKMEELGVETLVEVGSGKVLTGLTKRISPNLKSIALNTPTDIEEFLKAQ